MSEKLAVLFPGVGYQIDRPLLYHSAKLARERGYEVCTVSYPPLPTGLRGKPERIQQAIELCSRAAAEQLSGIVPDQHKQLLFISKSLGTAVAAVCAARFLSLRSRSTTRRSRTRLRISDAKVWFSTVPQTPGRAPRS